MTVRPTVKLPGLAELDTAPTRAEEEEAEGGGEHLLGECSRHVWAFRVRVLPGTNTGASAENTDVNANLKARCDLCRTIGSYGVTQRK